MKWNLNLALVLRSDNHFDILLLRPYTPISLST